MPSPPLPDPLRASTQPCVSCVVPSLNECESLRALLPALESVLAAAGVRGEIIVVDDGSVDGTPAFMREWADRPGRRCLQLSRNFGKEAALSAGLASANGEVVLCLDGDLQHPPSLIPAMLERWRNGVDMVYAVRRARDDEPVLKRLGTAMLYAALNRSSRVRIPAHAGDFRLMDRRVVSALLQMPERTRFMKGLYAWVGFRSEAIEYTPAPRQHGHSHFNYRRLSRLALDGITAFSTWPLTVMSVVGGVVALLAMAYGLFVVLEYFLDGNPVSGWTTIVTAMLFLSGVNLMGLGMLGAYVGRIFDEVKQRPLYLVRADLGLGLVATDRGPGT